MIWFVPGLCTKNRKKKIACDVENTQWLDLGEKVLSRGAFF